MSTTQNHPEPGSSFVVICKQDNNPETKCLPSYEFVHPSFGPSIHLSIHLSIHPFIQSFYWPCRGRRAKNGCHCFVSVALAPWPKEALAWASYELRLPIFGDSLTSRLCHIANIGVIHKELQCRRRKTNLSLSNMFISPKTLTIFFSPNNLLKSLPLKIKTKWIEKV